MDRAFNTFVRASVVTLLALVVPVQADAQTWGDLGFFHVSVGAQSTSRQVQASGSQPLYQESASWETAIGVGGSSMVDVGAGRNAWHGLAAGISFTSYSDTTNANVLASIPDTLFFDSHHADSAELGGLRHRERALHLSAYWRFDLPQVDRLSVVGFAGPSVFWLTKDVPGGIEVVNGGTTLASVNRTTIDGSAAGGHVGFDIQYTVFEQLSVLDHIGVGVLVRYGAASIDTDTANLGKVDVGGLNYGFGLRARF